MNYLSLKIFKDTQLLKTKIFTDDQISIGSSSGLNLHLPGTAPWHVLIEKKHDIYCVLGLDAEQKTFVNGRAITEETHLQSGDWIQIGEYKLQFFIGPPVQTNLTAAQVQTGQSQAGQPQGSQPRVGQPEGSQPQGSQPRVGQPEGSQPEVGQPRAGQPEGSQPEVGQPRVDQLQGSQPKVGQPRVDQLQGSQPKVGQPRVDQLQGSQPKVGQPQAGQPEGSQPQVDQSQGSQSQVGHSQVPNQYQSEKFQKSVPSFVETFAQSQQSKKSQKKSWNTYAPPSRVKNLEDIISPSVGNLIEVTLAWQDRVLKTYTFSKGQDIFIGSHKKCQIKFPNMLQTEAYKLMSISSGVQIYLEDSVKGVLYQGRNKSTRVSIPLNGNQNIILKPYEMVKLDFNSCLTVCVRLIDKPAQIPFVGLLNLRLSEALALFFAFLLTGLLIFYGTLYAPAFLAEDINFIEKDQRVALVIFEKKPPKQEKVVKYNLKKKTVKATTTIKKKKPRKIVKKRPAIKSSVKKVVKKISTPKKRKQGSIAAVARGRKKTTKKIKVGSARPGGSLKTGKAGSSAKTVAPDPTKVGLLSVFGQGGKLQKLDKGASGSGGLTGMASEYTGYSGTQDSYAGEGIGTKTKDLSSGGKGSAVIGSSGIKTSGKGLGRAGKGSGGLGERGRMSIEFSSSDIDVVGEIDREAIARVIRRNRAKFDRCYQSSLNASPSIQGKLLMQWQISRTGRGRTARALQSGIDNARLKRCVADVLENLVFPTPPAGQIPEVTFPFNFSL